MDLKDLKPKSDIIKVELAHPTTGEPLLNDDKSRMTISIYGPYSKEYKKVLYEHTKDKIASGTANLDPVDIEQLNIDVLSETTVSWNITFDGNNPELTKDLAKEIYEEVFWIKAQIDEAVKEALDFTKA